MSDEASAVETVETPGGDVETTDFAAENAKLLERIKKMDETIKRNFDDAENWRKHQDSLKSEQDKTAEAIATANRETAEARSELAIYKAVVKHGLSEEHAELLQGVDAEQIEARAQKLASLIGDSKADPFPKADPSQGPKGGADKRSNADAFAGFIESQLNT